MFRALLGLLLLCAGSSAHSARAAAAPGALTVSQLSLHLTAAERSNRRLSPETLLTAASMLDEHGVVRLCDALEDKVAEECARAVEENFDACSQQLKARGVPLNAPFAFREICHRAPLRYLTPQPPPLRAPCPKFRRPPPRRPFRLPPSPTAIGTTCSSGRRRASRWVRMWRRR